MKSKDLSTLEHPELPLVRKPQRIKISDELLTRQKNLAGAIALCIQLSGLDDKEIYLTLEIDAGHWTRIKKGEAHFPVNKLDELMELCGNEAPLYWQLMHQDMTLIPCASRKPRPKGKIDCYGSGWPNWSVNEKLSCGSLEIYG